MLVDEVIELLDVKVGGTYVDATVGGGGHAEALLKRIGPNGLLVGVDRDSEAIDRARARLAQVDGHFRLMHGNFGRLNEVLREHKVSCVDGILMDVGVSSDQLDTAVRGFSFAQVGPLDMRMDQSQEKSAADLVNTASEDQLCEILRKLGEEPRARQIARAIVAERDRRPLETTVQLADLVEQAVGGRRGRLHPATRTFQAMRIEVNNELDELRAGLAGGLSVLCPGGRMAVISFHSLEDRIVKRFFAGHVGRNVSLQQGGSEWVGEMPAMRLVNRKPVMASVDEQKINPRARSAKLRVGEVIGGSG